MIPLFKCYSKNARDRLPCLKLAIEFPEIDYSEIGQKRGCYVRTGALTRGMRCRAWRPAAGGRLLGEFSVALTENWQPSNWRVKVFGLLRRWQRFMLIFCVTFWCLISIWRMCENRDSENIMFVSSATHKKFEISPGPNDWYLRSQVAHHLVCLYLQPS